MNLLETGLPIHLNSMFFTEWRKPLNLSIGLHIVVLGLAMLAPTLFKSEPRLPEIYTVNLFSATEMAETPPPPAETPKEKPAAKPVVRQIEPEVKKPVVSIQPAKTETAPAEKTVPVKPVSLNPVVMKKKVGKTKEEEALEKARFTKAVERIKVKAAEKEARERADRAAKDAVSKLADSLKTTLPQTSDATTVKSTGQTDTTAETTRVSGPRGTGIEPSFYEKQYYSAIVQKIHDHWVLPDLQNWDNSLEAVLSIVIKRDGTVDNSYFEKKSANIYFNQFVLKAVKEASPLPPFPDQLEEDILEIGLRFKPGELGY
jgi:outer membrane biosynthesis protein TonB